jgi:hypothetical protein
MKQQTEQNNNNDNLIYTEYQLTKMNIWDSYAGWLKHYSNYLMTPNLENYMGMVKYAIRFVTLTRLTYHKFVSNDNVYGITQHEVNYEEVIYNKILNGSNLKRDEYIFLNDFFTKYMNTSGLTAIVTERENLGRSILKQ